MCGKPWEFHAHFRGSTGASRIFTNSNTGSFRLGLDSLDSFDTAPVESKVHMILSY